MSDPNLPWGREPRFWRTTAEVTGVIAFGLILFGSVVIR